MRRDAHSAFPTIANDSICPSRDIIEISGMKSLLVIAIFLMILWLILRVALAITGVALHLLWVAAVILAVLWLFGKLRGSAS